LAGVIQGMHLAVATRTQFEGWLMPDDQALEYGTLWSNALRHFQLNMTQKFVDFTALGIGIARFDGTRLIAYRAWLAARRAAMRPGMGHNQGPPMTGSQPGGPGWGPNPGPANGTGGEGLHFIPITPNTEFPN